MPKQPKLIISPEAQKWLDDRKEIEDLMTRGEKNIRRGIILVSFGTALMIIGVILSRREYRKTK